MPNLKFLTHVMHRGIVLKEGMIVSDQHQGLGEVAQDLIDRGLAVATSELATHTAALVNSVQEAQPVSAPAGAGQAPNADADEARKAEAQANQQVADSATANQVGDQAAKESEVKTVKRGLFGRGGNPEQPSAEEVAATAANIQ